MVESNPKKLYVWRPVWHSDGQHVCDGIGCDVSPAAWHSSVAALQKVIIGTPATHGHRRDTIIVVESEISMIK